MIPTDCRSFFVKHFSFWEHLSPEEQELICQNTTTRTYKKGENLHSSGDHCLGVLLLRSGHLRTYMLSEDGREITLYRLFKGDICILSASCVLEAITFDVFIDAEEDTEVLLINSSVFKKLSAQNVYVEAFAYKLATIRFSDVMWAMQQILFMSFDRRLAIFLLKELSKVSTNELHFTHEQIAKYMGSAREVVTRMLKYFANEGIVSLFRGGITVLDIEQLKQLAE